MNMVFVKASLWFHMNNKDVYTPCSSIEEAYFFASVLVDSPISYTNLVYELQKYKKVCIGRDDTIQIFIYTGTVLPPYDEFPYGICEMSKTNVSQHNEYKSRVQNA